LSAVAAPGRIMRRWPSGSPASARCAAGSLRL